MIFKIAFLISIFLFDHLLSSEEPGLSDEEIAKMLQEEEFSHEPPAILQEEQWECPVCTLINPATANICEACGGQRPEEDIEEQVAGQSFEEARKEALEKQRSYPEFVEEQIKSILDKDSGKTISESLIKDVVCPICMEAFQDSSPDEDAYVIGAIICLAGHIICRQCAPLVALT